MDDLKDLILPEEAPKAVRNWASAQLWDELGGDLCIFRRESVTLYPDEYFLGTPAKVKAVWGARCSCTACGEDFTAGFGNEMVRGERIKGIRMLLGDDEQLYPGIPEQEDGVWDRSAAEIAEGDRFDCPLCGTDVRLMHVSRLRGGRTWRTLIAQADAVAGRLVLLYWMASRACDETGCSRLQLYPRDAVVLDRDMRLRRLTHVRHTMGGDGYQSKWTETRRFREPGEIRYRTPDAVSAAQIGAYSYPKVPDLAGTTGEKTGIEDYIRGGGTWLAAYLLLWRRHPGAENLARQGWGRVLQDRLDEQAMTNAHTGQTRLPALPEIDWSKKKPHEMLGMDKRSFYALAGRWGADSLHRWAGYRDAAGDLRAEQLADAERELHPETIRWITERLRAGETDLALSRSLPYLRRQAARSGRPLRTLAGMLTDYREMLRARHAEPTEYERYPRDLAAAHDREAEAQKAREKTKFAGDFMRLREKYAPLSWSDGEICIRVAATPQELTDEGAVLHHCVGGYHSKHAAETDVIFFVRHARRPERSWYTLDIRMDTDVPREVQLHGYRNEWCDRGRLRIPQRVRDFCDRWEREVLLPWAAAQRDEQKGTKKRKRRIA